MRSKSTGMNDAQSWIMLNRGKNHMLEHVLFRQEQSLKCMLPNHRCSSDGLCKCICRNRV
eukprot:1157234-Pelagomonas_calceolata.AAC.17